MLMMKSLAEIKLDLIGEINVLFKSSTTDKANLTCYHFVFLS